MTHEEQVLKWVLKAVTSDDEFWVKLWYSNHKDYCELRDPVDEAESKDGKYYCRREAFVSSFDGRINYGYIVCEWDGTYREQKLSPNSSDVFKFKNWKEIFHTHTETKIKPAQMIEDALKLLGIIKEFDS